MTGRSSLDDHPAGMQLNEVELDRLSAWQIIASSRHHDSRRTITWRFEEPAKALAIPYAPADWKSRAWYLRYTDPLMSKPHLRLSRWQRIAVLLAARRARLERYLHTEFRKLRA